MVDPYPRLGPTSVVVLEQTRCSITGGSSAVKAQMVLAGSRAALHSWPSVWIEESDVTSCFICGSGSFHRCGKGVCKLCRGEISSVRCIKLWILTGAAPILKL